MKRKLYLLLVMGFVLILGACGGGENSSNGSNDENINVNVEAAKRAYEQNCLKCHGENLEGYAGPPLKEVGSKLSKEDILKTIQNGGGGMPGGLVEGETAENLAAWLASLK